MRCIILYDWNDYLKIAYDILNNNSIDSLDETRFRVSISRAYYAVFHNARILCESRKELKLLYYRNEYLIIKILCKVLEKIKEGIN